MDLKQFNKIFFAVLFAHLVILFKEPTHGLVLFTKPLILISLIGYFLQNGFKSLLYPQKLFLFGLVFSLLGDVLLVGHQYFIYGLGAFLIAQLSYTFAFFRSNFSQKGIIQLKPLLSAPIFLYTVLLIYVLKPKVGELLPAIVVYAVIISLMLLAAINRKGAVLNKSVNLVILGAFLFVLSDTLLAFNKFHTEFYGANIAVMLTYGLAQYFLVVGFVNLTPKINLPKSTA